MMNLVSVKMLKCSFKYSSQGKILGISIIKLPSKHCHVSSYVILLSMLVCGRNFAKGFLFDRLLFVIRCMCLETDSCGQFSLALVVSPPSRLRRLWGLLQFCS